jgi:ABC-type multidrug transport system fused ATPase/permease subunit
LLFLWFFILYTEIPLVIAPGKFIPSVGFIFLIPLFWPILKKSFFTRHLLFVLLGMLIALTTVAFQLNFSLVGSSVIKLLQYGYSLLLCMFTYVMLTSIEFSEVKKALQFFLVFIVLGTVLERIGIIAPLTNAFRTLYAGTSYGGEIDAEREVLIAGFVRPYVFTSEPSLVGLGFFVFAVAHSMLARTKTAVVAIMFLVFVMFQLLGSPTVVLTLLVLLSIYLYKYGFSVKVGLYFTGFVGAVSLITLLIPPVSATVKLLLDRVFMELLDDRSSIYARLFVPYVIMLPKVLSSYPLFGVGLGNYGYINVLFGYSYHYLEEDSIFFLGANGFATNIAYFGIVGTILMFFNFQLFHKLSGLKALGITILFFILIGQMSAAMATPRFWGYIGICLAGIKWMDEKKLNNILNAT